MRIVLRNEQKLHHLEEALPEAPPATLIVVVRNAYTSRVTEQQEVACLMLQAEQELFETIKAFHACKQEERQSVSTYVLKMKAYLDQMERLGYPMPLVLGVNLILTSLSKDYDQVEEEQSQYIWHIRADDLLGIIHSDVCGPFRTTSREGANYYVTFTDDFSGYGYVYKHEVFEMFKTFQNEVENQLRMTIKALRLDRGGEYLSQEFLDHLRSRGIISQLIPPYTPQHNGVLERRNQTLLDMVRSMMSLTTLPMSFWGYALDPAACILNMVQTKKVNKTPYEMWHGKVPNLSYLKVWGCKANERIPYAPAMGSIMYAVRCTRPDIAFSQNLTSRYQQNPGKSHWTAVKNILKYLRNTKDMFLAYGGFVFVMNGGTVNWKSSKQRTTAMSSMEAEYIADAEAAMEAIWIRKFIYGLDVVPSIDKPMDMYCDNTCAITIAVEPGVQRGAKNF
nr:retrotransposon protein, putative, Ty1-copia subclass [Tanacetum cinerariifolium]